MDKPEIIMAPGPTPVPPEVFLAQGSPLVYHRGPGYGALLREVTENLQRAYRTKNDVVIFASSGTGGLESAVANLFSPGDRVVVPVAGYFGERFAKIAKAFGQDVRTIDYEWGREVEADDVRRALEEQPAKAVLMQQSETSTGVIHDVEAVGRVTRHAGVLLVVDVVSSLGAVPYDGDGWGVDVAIGGSQKAFSATPGLAFASISAKAWEATKTARNPRFYFDWASYKKSYDLPSPENPFTPAISLMLGMGAALRRFFDEGPDAVLDRHRILSAATKEGVRALGLDLFGEDLERAWTVTAIRAPEGIDADAICARIRADHGIVLAPGQGPLKGKVFRIGSIGEVGRYHVMRTISSIASAMNMLGIKTNAEAASVAMDRLKALG